MMIIDYILCGILKNIAHIRFRTG